MISKRQITKISILITEDPDVFNKNTAPDGNAAQNGMGQISNQIDQSFASIAKQYEGKMKPQVIAALIEQAEAIREQLRKERDINNWHRLRMMYVKQLKEVQKYIGDDPKTKQALNNWIDNYVNDKTIALDETTGLKEQAQDHIENIQNAWGDAQMSLAQGGVETYEMERHSHKVKTDSYIDGLPDDSYSSDKWSAQYDRHAAKGSGGLLLYLQQWDKTMAGYDWASNAPSIRYFEEFRNYIYLHIRKAAGRTNANGLEHCKNAIQLLKSMSADAKALANIVTKLRRVREQSNMALFQSMKVP